MHFYKLTFFPLDIDFTCNFLSRRNHYGLSFDGTREISALKSHFSLFVVKLQVSTLFTNYDTNKKQIFSGHYPADFFTSADVLIINIHMRNHLITLYLLHFYVLHVESTSTHMFTT